MQKKEQIDHEISSNYNPKRQSRKYLGKNNPKNHESVFLAFVFVTYVSQDSDQISPNGLKHSVPHEFAYVNSRYAKS